jgi:hypothetical protein
MDAQFQASQAIVKIKEVKNGIIHLKSGGLRKILIVGGVNFDLKSNEEQLAIISSFQSFLNTLDFLLDNEAYKSKKKNEIEKSGNYEVDYYDSTHEIFEDPMNGKVLNLCTEYADDMIDRRIKKIMG